LGIVLSFLKLLFYYKLNQALLFPFESIFSSITAKVVFGRMLVTGIVYTCDQLVIDIVDSSCKLVTRVMGTGHKMVTGKVDTGDKLVTDIVDTSDILVTWSK
jgi:hypothetical protein